jgi:hypothetical protein
MEVSEMLRANLPKVDIPQDVADALRAELERVKALGEPVKAGYRFTELYWEMEKKEGK